jgi:hypothetical protein
MLASRGGLLRRGFCQAPKQSIFEKAKGLVKWAVHTVGEVYQDTQEYVQIGRTKGWKVKLDNHHLFTIDEYLRRKDLHEELVSKLLPYAFIVALPATPLFMAVYVVIRPDNLPKRFMTDHMIAERIEKWRNDRLKGFEGLNRFVDLNGTRYSPSLDDLPAEALEALCKIWLKEFRPGYLLINFLYTAFVKSPFLLASWIAKKRGDPNYIRFKDFPWCNISFPLNTGPLSLYKRKILLKQLKRRLELLKVEDSIMISNTQSLEGLKDPQLVELAMDRLWNGSTSEARQSVDWLKQYWLNKIGCEASRKSTSSYPEQLLWEETRRAYKSLVAENH